MRVLFFIFGSLFYLTALADSIPDHAGWSLEAQVKDGEAEGSYDYQQYYTLQPPGPLQPISVEASVAHRLMKGQLDPATIYQSRTGTNMGIAAPASKTEDSNAVGWQVADPIYSTAASSDNPNAGLAGAVATARDRAVAKATAESARSPASLSFGSSAGFNSLDSKSDSSFSLNGGNSVANTMQNTAAFQNLPASAGPDKAAGPAKKASTAISFAPNQTYKEMLEAAQSQAAAVNCASMGRFAKAGDCK